MPLSVVVLLAIVSSILRTLSFLLLSEAEIAAAGAAAIAPELKASRSLSSEAFAVFCGVVFSPLASDKSIASLPDEAAASGADATTAAAGDAITGAAGAGAAGAGA